MLPGMMVVAVLATVATGLAEQVSDMAEWGEELRYFLPAVWLPLFVGWALLPWRLPRLGVTAASGVLAAACFAYIAIVRPPLQGLNPFATAFHDCFARHAQERGWVGGIGGWEYLWLLADPATPMERYLLLDIHTQEETGKGSMYYFKDNANLGWFRGTVNFAVINEPNPDKLVFPPLDPQANACVGPDRIECPPRGRVLSEARARTLIGPEAGMVECAGVRFGLFDPPRVFEVSL